VSPKERAIVELAIGLSVSLVGVVAILLFLDQYLGNGSFDGDYVVTYIMGMLALPGVRLAIRGANGLRGSEKARERRPSLPRQQLGEKHTEQQLLEAIERHGEATPARIALETSLTVAEADAKLRELAEGGYVEVRARDGKLVYSL